MEKEQPLYTVTLPMKWLPVERNFMERVFRRPPRFTQGTKTFSIYPSVCVNTIRIAKKALTIPKEVISGSLSEVTLPLVEKHLPDLIYIVAAAIQNNHLEPEPELIEIIEKNFNQEQIHEAFLEAMEALLLKKFFDCIVLCKGNVRILKPEEQQNAVE